MMQIKLLTPDDRASWNDFVRSMDGSVLQSYEWGELKGKFGWQPLRLALLDSGRIVACASILKKRLSISGRSVFYSPQGPVVPVEDENVLSELLAAVKKLSAEHGAIEWKIDPPFEEGSGIESLLKRKGFVRNRKQIQPRVTYHLDLTSGENDLLMSFEEKTRYNIRLAEKKGVAVSEANTEEGIADFYCIYEETARRDNFLIHPFSYYSNIKDLLMDRGLASLFLAHYKGRPISGVFIFAFGRTIWYMYGASSADARNVMPNHALHWHVIRWAKQKGYGRYDLWGIPANPTEDHPLWGVYRFKKGFNGKLVRNIGVYDLPIRPMLYFIFEKGAVMLKNAISLVKKGKIEDSLGE